jgi:hypothetical protein
MDVERVRCHACGSLELHNVTVREVGAPEDVFVACARCGELVGRYRLAGHYRHGEEFEASLRSPRWASAESGRATLDEFRRARVEAEEQYAAVLARVRDEPAAD